ncbi:MAG: hypothetical protein ACI32E_01755 [Bacilli bacterium]
MNVCKINQTNKEFILEQGLLKVNIYNGRAIYNYPILSYGSGSFQIDLSLVYNSYYDNYDFLNQKIGFENDMMSLK